MIHDMSDIKQRIRGGDKQESFRKHRMTEISMGRVVGIKE
jgi:hypothetical protein